MYRAGIAEAKNSLSALLDKVKAGDSVIIEDRGVPVARLESVSTPGQPGATGRTARLVRQGVLRLSAGLPVLDVLKTAPPKPRGRRRASEAVIEERRGGR